MGSTRQTASQAGDSGDRFEDWQYPEIREGEPTKYGWMVRRKDNLKPGCKTDIGAFACIDAKFGVSIGDCVRAGSRCPACSVSTIDDKTGPVAIKKNCRIGSHTVRNKNFLNATQSICGPRNPARVLPVGDFLL